MLNEQTWMDLEMAQLKSNLTMETERSLQVIEARDQALSRLSTQEQQLTNLRLGLTWVTSQMAELRSQHSVISEGVTNLASEF